MQDKDQKYFELLKQKIVAVMQQSYPGINPSITEWKGQEITDFQEDLQIKVSATLSEKWFYTHMKSSQDALPRIDVLNFLSRYAGCSNWDDFVFKNKQEDTVILVNKTANRYFFLIPLLALGIVGVFFGIFTFFNTQQYRFSFIDADTHEPVINNKTEITLLLEGESPAHFLVGNDGCFKLKTDKSLIRMVVNSPCYQSDTITRIVRKMIRNEVIVLKPDDYALMIHYFLTMKVDDWEKRRKKLNEMIDDGAMIYQVINSKEATGMALYNKNEFIDKLTMPAGSLKNIEVLASQFSNGKLMVLRFRTNDIKR